MTDAEVTKIIERELGIKSLAADANSHAIFHAGAAWQREQDARIAEGVDDHGEITHLAIAAAIRRAGEA